MLEIAPLITYCADGRTDGGENSPFTEAAAISLGRDERLVQLESW